MDAVLHHLARYRLSTFAVMSQLPEFTGQDPHQLRQVLRAARQLELLSSAVLHAGLRYWFLMPAGAIHCRLDASRSGPLSEAAKLRAYALLLFCCASAKPRHRLTAAEMGRQFPALHRPGMPGTYYFDPKAKGCIGLARIDVGHHGRWDRVVQSVKADLSLHMKLPGFRELIAAGRFEISVVTVLPAKAERIAAVFHSLPEVQQVPLRVDARPDLLPLMGSI